MKYRAGDTVKIKSLDWYNANKNSEGNVFLPSSDVFAECMSEYCGMTAKVDRVSPYGFYELDIDKWFWDWVDGFLQDSVDI